MQNHRCFLLDRAAHGHIALYIHQAATADRRPRSYPGWSAKCVIASISDGKPVDLPNDSARCFDQYRAIGYPLLHVLFQPGIPLSPLRDRQIHAGTGYRTFRRPDARFCNDVLQHLKARGQPRTVIRQSTGPSHQPCIPPSRAAKPEIVSVPNNVSVSPAPLSYRGRYPP